MNKRKTGKILMFSSFFIWLLDRTTDIISNILGQILYGEDYMRLVDGTLGDMSYGFNTDMHLAFSLGVIFILGLALYVSSQKSKLLDEELSSEEL